MVQMKIILPSLIIFLFNINIDGPLFCWLKILIFQIYASVEILFVIFTIIKSSFAEQSTLKTLD